VFTAAFCLQFIKEYDDDLDMSRCWDVAIFCSLVVFVAGVRVVEFGSDLTEPLLCGWKQDIFVKSFDNRDVK